MKSAQNGTCAASPSTDDADRDGDERIDDGEAGDHEVGRADRVGGLHEVGAERRREQHADDADDREPLELPPPVTPAISLPTRLMTTLARVATNP